MTVLQNLLVDLVTYLERAEGFSVSVGDRRKARLRGVHAQVAIGQPGITRILHHTRGRIRLGVPRVKKDRVYVGALQSLLESMENVESVRVSAGAASVVIGYSSDIPEAEFTRRVLKTVEEGSYSTSAR